MATAGRMANQVAWISGAGSGMGEATARLFAAEGASVILADIDADNAQRVADQINSAGHRCIVSVCDVSHESEVARSINDGVDAFGRLQTIVNCAGIAHVTPLHETTEQQWDALMGINVKSIFFSLKHGIEHLRKYKRSYMVNVGSISTFVGQGSTPAYTTSKGAVLQLSRSIALDYAADGLRCNCICPGITDTPLLRYHLGKNADDTDAALAARLQRVPMGVALQPNDIARSIRYFCCEDSSGVTGTSLIIDGGYLAAAEWQTPGHTRFMEPIDE